MGAALGLATALHVASASAQQAAPPKLELSAHPTFAAGPNRANTTELSVFLHNTGTTPLTGNVELMRNGGFGPSAIVELQTPFRAGAGDKMLLQIPCLERDGRALRIKLDDGRTVESPSISEPTGETQAGVVVALGYVSQALALRTAAAVRAGAGTPGASSRSNYSVMYPVADGMAGDLVFPRSLAGYGGVDLLIIDTEHLLRQSPDNAQTLHQWVRDGGELALVVSREADLLSPRLTEFAHGTIRADHEPPTRVLAERGNTFVAPPQPANPYAPPALPETMPGAAPGDGATATTAPFKPAPDKLPESSAAPANVSATSSGYVGGYLKKTGFGTRAEFGHGGITFLAFQLDHLSDVTWVQERIFSLTDFARANRERVFAKPDILRNGSDSGTQRGLDANENYGISLGVATLLLIAYALVVGPWIFLRAKRRGKLFEPFALVPAAAAIAFFAVVIVGMLSRGVRNHVRRLTFIDLGAGMSDAAAIRYRGFHTSKTSGIDIKASAARSAFALADNSMDSNTGGALQIAASGDIYTGLRAPPWSTVAVKEVVPMVEVGAIALARNDDGSVRITNSTNYKLKNLVVSDGRQRFYPIAELPAGQTKVTEHATSAARLGSGSQGLMTWQLSETYGAAMNDWKAVWEAHQELLGNTEVWVANRPTLLAQIEGMPQPLEDSGYAIGRDTVLVRVVGESPSP